MNLSVRSLNRATLERQFLLERAQLDPLTAVRRLVALQAQEPASPYIALWNRLADFDAAQLDAAFEERSLVKSSLLRLTLHAAHADDYAPYYRAMLSSLRASRLYDRRFRDSGLTIEEVDGVVPELLEFLARPRSTDEVNELLEDRLGPGSKWAWWALKTYAPLHRAPTGSPWAFESQPAYVAAKAVDAGAGSSTEPDPESVKGLLLRYLEAFGPAQFKDFGQFTLLRQPVIKAAAAELRGQLVKLSGPAGEVLYDVAGAPVPPEGTPAPPRLLPMWDSILLAYADRSRVIPPEYRSLVIRRNGDTLPTLLVDGHVAGVWRPVEEGIELTAFHPLDDEAWSGLTDEASALACFLAGREPLAYSRYGYWWKEFAGYETRVVAP